jgi:hypothetical protein
LEEVDVVIAIGLRPPFILSFERIPDRQCTKSSKQFKGLGANLIASADRPAN